MKLDYFYGAQADMFSFLRIPKLLLTDAHYSCISSDAKLLYSIMLDRMGLSAANGWMDKQGRVFIVFTIEEVCKTFRISKATAVKCMAELDTKSGIGLIERVRVGRGHADRIYVLNFVSDCPLSEDAGRKNNCNSTGSGTPMSDSEKTKAHTPSPAASVICTQEETGHLKKYKNHTSRCGLKIKPLEVKKLNPNNTEKNNTITLSSSHISHSNNTGISMPAREGLTDLTARDYESIRADVAEQVEADTLKEEYGAVIDDIVEVITDIMVSPAPTIRIAGADRPIDGLRSQFARLTAAHVEAALWNLRKHASEPITDAKAYMRALLYDALFSMNLRVAAEVSVL